MKIFSKMILTLILLLATASIAQAANWNEEPPKKVSISDPHLENAKVLNENRYESWLRHYNSFGAWDYYCYKGNCCLLVDYDKDEYKCSIDESTRAKNSFVGTYELISNYPNGGTELMIRKNSKYTDETYYDIQILASMGAQSGGFDAEGLPFEDKKIYSVTDGCSYEIIFSDKGAKVDVYEGDCSDKTNGLPFEGEYKKISDSVEW